MRIPGTCETLAVQLGVRVRIVKTPVCLFFYIQHISLLRKALETGYLSIDTVLPPLCSSVCLVSQAHTLTLTRSHTLLSSRPLKEIKSIRVLSVCISV